MWPTDSLVHVESVLGGKLVAATNDELEFLERDTESSQESLDEERVVLCAPLDLLEGRLAGVEESVHV